MAEQDNFIINLVFDEDLDPTDEEAHEIIKESLDPIRPVQRVVEVVDANEDSVFRLAKIVYYGDVNEAAENVVEQYKREADEPDVVLIYELIEGAIEPYLDQPTERSVRLVLYVSDNSDAYWQENVEPPEENPLREMARYAMRQDVTDTLDRDYPDLTDLGVIEGEIEYEEED